MVLLGRRSCRPPPQDAPSIGVKVYLHTSLRRPSLKEPRENPEKKALKPLKALKALKPRDWSGEWVCCSGALGSFGEVLGMWLSGVPFKGFRV